MTEKESIDQIQRLSPEARTNGLEALPMIEAEQDIVIMDDEIFDRAADLVLERHADLLRKLAQ